MSPVPFAVAVPDNHIAHLKQKLDLTRWPDELDGAAWDYGVPLADVKRLVQHWRDGFDWRAQEQKINDTFAGQQFTTDVEVDGHGTLNIHFVQKRSPREGAIPLLFCHGWPGSFLEVTKILPLLTEPASDALPAFHVVALSLPGYAFSEAPRKPGFGIPQYAEVAHKLMLQLGYTEYVTQGGDWGFRITRMMGTRYGPQHCKASHLNMHSAAPPSLLSHPKLWLQDKLLPYSEREKRGIAFAAKFQKVGMGYNIQQRTRPQTLGYALADSPAGLLAWIYEKLVDWSDGYAWTDDEVLTWVSIYWFSRAGPAASSRIYYETMALGNDALALRTSPVPLGLSFFPVELLQYPRTWSRALGRVVFEGEHDKGGHFAAYEQPDALVGDLRRMFGRGGAAFGVIRLASGYGAGTTAKL